MISKGSNIQELTINIEPTIKDMCYLADDLVYDLQVSINKTFDEVIKDNRLPREIKITQIRDSLTNFVNAIKIRSIICNEDKLGKDKRTYEVY